jgi:hypothetical protein
VTAVVIRLRCADDPELAELLVALGLAQANPQFARSAILREEGEMYRVDITAHL